MRGVLLGFALGLICGVATCLALLSLAAQPQTQSLWSLQPASLVSTAAMLVKGQQAESNADAENQRPSPVIAGDADPTKEVLSGRVAQMEKELDTSLEPSTDQTNNSNATPTLDSTAQAPPLPDATTQQVATPQADFTNSTSPAAGSTPAAAAPNSTPAQAPPTQDATIQQVATPKFDSQGGAPRRIIQHVRRTQENVDAAARETAITKLVEDIKKNVKPQYVDRCVKMVKGEEGSLKFGWSGQGQDWALFHNLFVHIPYGKGTYLELAANDPRRRSNSAFFDWCLGWKGICVEPNPKYHPYYAEGSPRRIRSCKLVKSCVSNSARSLWMDFRADGTATAASKAGPQRVEVPCQSLDNLLRSNNITGPGQLDYISLDIEGSELLSVFCFPFQKYKVPVWLVETTHSDQDLIYHFIRNGYAAAAQILGWGHPKKKCNTGLIADTIFLQMDPPMALGPQWLPGRPLSGLHPRGACAPGAKGLACPDQLMVLTNSETINRTKKGVQFKLGACGPVLVKNTTDPNELAKQPPFDLLSAREPKNCFVN